MRRFLCALLLLPSILINLSAPWLLRVGRYEHMIEIFLVATSAALTVVLIVPQPRKILLGFGLKLGLPHLDMNVEFQPQGALLRTLWILSSAVTLTSGFPAFAMMNGSPPAACSTKRDRCVLASWILTVFIN